MNNSRGAHFSRFFLLLLTLICLTGCDTFAPSLSSTPTMDLRAVDDIASVIFSPEQAEAAQVELLASVEGNFEGYWMPSGKELLTLEEQLGPYLQAHADQFFAHPTVWEQLDEYHRQYAGLTVDGVSLIYGNFFCGEGQMDWLTEWVIVMDGGDCYFQILYNVKNDTFIRLQVNGDA
ncbi:MAG TPA: hypothetical protein PK530_11855 [Anaerolineales bacterium]|nr:hypothetical protein [Anaerolineales bacterium]